MFHPDADAKDFMPLIKTDLLDAYQQRFISEFCWLALTPGSSLCHGDFYITIRREPDSFLISPELEGAVLKDADEQMVLSRLSS